MHGQNWDNGKPAAVALTLAVLLVLSMFCLLVIAKCIETIGGRM